MNVTFHRKSNVRMYNMIYMDSAAVGGFWRTRKRVFGRFSGGPIDTVFRTLFHPSHASAHQHPSVYACACACIYLYNILLSILIPSLCWRIKHKIYYIIQGTLQLVVECRAPVITAFVLDVVKIFYSYRNYLKKKKKYRFTRNN